MKPTLYLIDGSMYVFRAWHAMPPDFLDRNGQSVSAVHGFVRFLLDFLEQTRATHILVAFDGALHRSFRHDLYPPYKANREPPPPEFEYQFERCQHMTQALGLPCISDTRYEADDLIGSAHAAAKRLGWRNIIVSADKDFGQLLTDTDQQWDYARKQRWGAAGVVRKLGVEPAQVADYLALCGDSVDNIPGVPGIGAKTAAQLLQHFGTLEALLQRVDEVPFLRLRGAKRCADNLRRHADDVRLFQQLTRIACDAEVSAHTLLRQAPDKQQLSQLADDLVLGPLTRARLNRLSANEDHHA